jgi:predicted transcriptional regulator
MMLPKITDAEEKVMTALWGYEPSALGEIAQRLTDTGWSGKTVKTLIDRLCDKGAVGIERWGRRNRYYSLVERDEFVKEELGSLTTRLFGGSPQEMMAFFCRTQDLTPEQARSLIVLLEGREDDA